MVGEEAEVATTVVTVMGLLCVLRMAPGECRNGGQMRNLISAGP